MDGVVFDEEIYVVDRLLAFVTAATTICFLRRSLIERIKPTFFFELLDYGYFCESRVMNLL